VAGQSLATFGAGEWDRRRHKELLTATVSQHTEIEAYKIDLVRPVHATLPLVLNAQKLDYDDEGHVRLILAVSYVTEATTTTIWSGSRRAYCESCSTASPTASRSLLAS
jgi:hypothetical protein